MSPSSIRTLAFVILSVLVFTSSCGTLLNPDPPAVKNLSFND